MTDRGNTIVINVNLAESQGTADKNPSQKVAFAVDAANFGQSLAQILRADAVKYCDTIYLHAAEDKLVIAAKQRNRNSYYACSIERTVPAIIADDLQGTFCLQRKTATLFERVARAADVAAAKSAREHAKRRAEAAAVTATDKEFARLATLLVHVRAAKANARLIALGDKIKLKLLSPRQTDITPNVAVNDAAAPLTLKIAQDELRGLLNRTLYAADIRDTWKPIYSCVNLQTTPQGLLVQASDKHILAQTLTAKFTCNGEINCNIPAVVMKFVADLLSTESAGRDVTIKFYPPAKNFSTAEIFFDDWRICTTCPNESFPDTSKVINSSATVHARIDSKIFLDALNFVALLTDTNEYAAVELNFGRDNALTIKTTIDGIGSASMRVKALIHGVESGTARGNFKIQYLFDTLARIDDDNVALKLTEIGIVVRGKNTTAVIGRLKCDC